MVGAACPRSHFGGRRSYQTFTRAVLSTFQADAGIVLSTKLSCARLEKREDSDGAWKALAHGLLGGGLALFARGDSKLGCLLLLAAAGVLKCKGWEGLQDRNKSEIKTAKESNKKWEGPEPPKYQSWSGTAERGVTGTAKTSFGEKASATLGGRSPGLRAFRMNPGRKDGSDRGTSKASYVGGRSPSQEGGTPYTRKKWMQAALLVMQEAVRRLVVQRRFNKLYYHRRNQCE